MRNHTQIVRDAAKADEIAEACSTPERPISIHTVRSWAHRDSIPADKWKVFADRGWATLEELAAAAAGEVVQPESDAA